MFRRVDSIIDKWQSDKNTSTDRSEKWFYALSLKTKTPHPELYPDALGHVWPPGPELPKSVCFTMLSLGEMLSKLLAGPSDSQREPKKLPEEGPIDSLWKTKILKNRKSLQLLPTHNDW